MSSKPEFDITKLSSPVILKKEHDNLHFSCSEIEIDEFIHTEALDFQERLLGVTYLFYFGSNLAGFVTLCMGHINKEKMASEDRLQKQIGNYPSSYPALLIGQLGVAQMYQRYGVGRYICDFSFDRAIKFSQRVGCRFLVVNAVESAVGFYTNYGFVLAPKQEKQKQKLMFLDITKRKSDF